MTPTKQRICTISQSISLVSPWLALGLPKHVLLFDCERYSKNGQLEVGRLVSFWEQPAKSKGTKWLILHRHLMLHWRFGGVVWSSSDVCHVTLPFIRRMQRQQTSWFLKRKLIIEFHMRISYHHHHHHQPSQCLHLTIPFSWFTSNLLLEPSDLIGRPKKPRLRLSAKPSNSDGYGKQKHYLSKIPCSKGKACLPTIFLGNIRYVSFNWGTVVFGDFLRMNGSIVRGQRKTGCMSKVALCFGEFLVLLVFVHIELVFGWLLLLWDERSVSICYSFKNALATM